MCYHCFNKYQKGSTRFKMKSVAFVTTFVVLNLIDLSVADECCRSYTDRYGNWQNSQWCSEYCCDKVVLHILSLRRGSDLECCDNIYRRTESFNRMDTCEQWWSEHAWVPALISLGCIGAITACCFGCFKLCSSNGRTQGMVVPQPQGPGVVMMASQQNNATQQYPSSTQGHAAYPPGAYPGAYAQGAHLGGPPRYDSGVPPNAHSSNP